MNYKNLILSKIDNTLVEISFLKSKRYSYRSSLTALTLLEKHFEQQKKLIKIFSEGDKLKELCVQVQNELSAYMEIIGLIANSANIRNLFEVYEPLWRLASMILEPEKNPKMANINLIISSEWRGGLSAFVFSTLPFSSILKDYILIGLPATESANPLLIPLAGHELGHIVWKKYDIKTKIQSKIKSHVAELLSLNNTNKQLTLFDNSYYAEISELALRQTEEVFCDLVGLRLFRMSYIYAFFYLLFPWKREYTERHYPYPPISERLAICMDIASQYKLPLAQEIDYKPTQHKCANDQCKCLCESRKRILPDIIIQLDSIIARKKKTIELMGTNEEVTRIASKMRKIVPATEIKSLSDIVNAGWVVYFEKMKQDIHPDDRLTIPTLMDLVAKNYEIFSIEQRMA